MERRVQLVLCLVSCYSYSHKTRILETNSSMWRVIVLQRLEQYDVIDLLLILMEWSGAEGRSDGKTEGGSTRLKRKIIHLNYA